jgi:phage baseplate assembly protein W
MKALLPLTPVQLARAENRLLHPAPGSRIEAARNYGTDLTLLVEQLRLTPAERALKLELASTALEQVRGVVRKHF